jgi:hypothetical protein
VKLDADKIKELHAALHVHIEKCFETESVVGASIKNGGITTEEQVAAAYTAAGHPPKAMPTAE